MAWLNRVLDRLLGVAEMTPLGLLAAVGVALALLLLEYLGGVGRTLRGIAARPRTASGPVVFDLGAPPDHDPETIARLIEFAQAGNRADFDWLALSAGVPQGNLDAAWEGTCQRARRGRPFAHLRLGSRHPRGERITTSRPWMFPDDFDGRDDRP